MFFIGEEDDVKVEVVKGITAHHKKEETKSDLIHLPNSNLRMNWQMLILEGLFSKYTSFVELISEKPKTIVSLSKSRWSSNQ